MSKPKLKKLIKENKLFFLILLLGLFLRVYKPAELFMYSHDNDLSGWFVRDVIDSGHLRLIGQETSARGIFIGPLFYYLLIPFYFLFNMDPIGGVVMITILGLFSLWSFYYVFKNTFGKNEGLIASLLFATSYFGVFNDREVVPTMPVVLWTVWFFYSINLILKEKKTVAYLILGVLAGLIWDINLALALAFPLVIFSEYLSKKKIDLKSILRGLLVFAFLSLPLVLFELRHNFIQVKVILNTFLGKQPVGDQVVIHEGSERVVRVLLLASKNVSSFFWGNSIDKVVYIAPVLLLLIFAYLYRKRVISKSISVIISLWLLLYVVFFSSVPIVISEYYLNGMLIVWITISTLFISYLLRLNKLKIFGMFLLVIFASFNLYRFFSIDINKSGYLYRKAIVREIDIDSKQEGYPCVSVSYITNPGLDLGYRYFFYLRDMHVNRPDSGSPVYTIVFPLRRDIAEDKSFGHIGLIYPDYSRYTKEEVEESCAGENSNLTDPMFGFTN